LVNHTAKRYLFEQSAVREFYSGAYYDLFLVMRGSGVFRCSEVVLPAQQQNYQQAYQQPYGYQQQTPYTNNPMK